MTTAWVVPGADGEEAVPGEFDDVGTLGPAVVEGALEEALEEALELGTGVVGATHSVQMVEVEVVRTVETLWVTSTEVLVPEVWVLVTGQVVKVV